MAFPKKHRLNFMIISCLSIALSIVHFGISASANNFIQTTVTVTNATGGKSSSAGWYMFTLFGTLQSGSYWGGILVCVAGIFGVASVHSRKASRAFVIACAIIAGLGIGIGIFAVAVDSSFVAYWNYTGPESCAIVASMDDISYFGAAANDASKQSGLHDCAMQFTLAATTGLPTESFVSPASVSDCYCTTANYNSGNVNTHDDDDASGTFMTGKCYNVKLVNARPDIGSYEIMDAKATNADPQNNIKMNMAGYKNCNNVLKAYPSTVIASALFCFVSLAICICLFCYAVAILSQPYDKTDDYPEGTQTMVQMAPQTTHEPATFTTMPVPSPMMPVTAPMLVPNGMPMGGGMAPVTFGPGGISGTPMPMSMMQQQQMQMQMPMPMMQQQQTQMQMPMPMPPFTTMAPGPKAV